MRTWLVKLRERVAGWFRARPCERCGAPGCCVFVYAAVRVVEGAGGTSVGMRVNDRTPPPEWLCRACVPVAHADHAARVRNYNAPGGPAG